jgi:hypothetical protein
VILLLGIAINITLLLFCFFVTGSPYVVQAGLKLTILLPLLPKYLGLLLYYYYYYYYYYYTTPNPVWDFNRILVMG